MSQNMTNETDSAASTESPEESASRLLHLIDDQLDALTSESRDCPANPVAANGNPGTPLEVAPSAIDPQQATILVVDDEPLNIDVVRGLLEFDGYERFVSTTDPVESLQLVEDSDPDLVLLDIHMPGMSGLDVLRAIRGIERFATLPVVILTASSDENTRLTALELGATDFLQKPLNRAELSARIRNVLTVKAHQDHLKNYSQELAQAVARRTSELEQSRQEVIHCLARAAEFRDDDTGHHVIRVGRFARIIGEQLGLSDEELDVLEPAAQLHDVGKIGIPDSILLKPGKLTDEEFEMMQRHCGFGKKIVDPLPAEQSQQLRDHAELGARIMDGTRSPVLSMAKRIALTHHEKWDGSGYPLGLAGEHIPLEGRITAVADVFDALSSRRPYKKPFPLEKCLAILEEGRASHFDPTCMDAFLARLDDIVNIQIHYADDE